MGVPGLGHLAAARPEQRPGLRRRRLHPHQPAGLRRLHRGEPRPLRAGLGTPPAGRAGSGGDRDGGGLPRRPRPRHVRGGREPAPVGARSPPRREGDRAARLPGGAGPLHARDRGARARVPARGRLRREGRDLHELRAPRAARAAGPAAARPDARRTGGSPASWPAGSPGGWVCPPPASTGTIPPRSGTRWPGSGRTHRGISYARLESGGLQWPCPTPDHPGTRFLYGGVLPAGPRPLRAGGADRRGRRAA